MRIYHRSSSKHTHAGDNSNLSILNNGGEAESKQDSKDEVKAARARSLKVLRAVSSMLVDTRRHTDEVCSCVTGTHSESTNKQ